MEEPHDRMSLSTSVARPHSARVRSRYTHTRIEFDDTKQQTRPRHTHTPSLLCVLSVFTDHAEGLRSLSRLVQWRAVAHVARSGARSGLRARRSPPACVVSRGSRSAALGSPRRERAYIPPPPPSRSAPPPRVSTRPHLVVRPRSCLLPPRISGRTLCDTARVARGPVSIHRPAAHHAHHK